MIKIILISHGDLSKEMCKSAQMITGEKTNVSYYGLHPGEHPSEMMDKIKNEVEKNKENDFIIVADILGGSVCNSAMELLELKNVRLISGMNLSLVIDLLLSSDKSDEELKGKINNARVGIELFSNPENIKVKEEDSDFF